jgi:GTP cyclohydrolase I
MAGNDDPLPDLVRGLLREIGEDPDREGLAKTPHRVAEAMRFLTRGYEQSLEAVVNGAVFEEECDEMVVVKDIELFSLCEHHMLPFVGKAHVAYLPAGRIVGLSKIPRIVDMYSRRLQVQERLTVEVANALMNVLEPRGVGVVVEASHLCMMMRGVEKQNSKAVTSCMLGTFREDPRTRSEFLNLVHR